MLWDVDQTLLVAAGFGWNAYAAAFAELYGTAVLEPVPMAGRTDRAIMTEALARAGISAAAEITAFGRAVARIAATQAGAARDGAARDGAALGNGARALAGAEAALVAVAARSDVVSSVLTGNMRELALAKLGAFGLDRYLDLDVAAYGDEHERRADLVEVARGLALAKYRRDFAGAATVLVGDTPLDVEAAHAAGARVVGVATGSFSVADLVAAGAGTVLDDLTDTAAVVAAVLSA